MDALTILTHKVAVTRSCRFNGADRLAERHRRSVLLISFLSLFVILLSLLPSLYELDRFNRQLLTVLAVADSIFIIIISLADSGMGFSSTSDHLRKSGRELTALSVKLAAMKSTNYTDADLEVLSDLYAKLCADCPVEHGYVDYVMVKVRQPELFSGLDTGNINSNKTRDFFLSLYCSLRSQIWMALPLSVMLASLYVVLNVLATAQTIK